MSKLKFILLAATMLLLACSKKNSQSPVKTNNDVITGRWYTVTDTVISYVNGAQTQFFANQISPGDYDQFNADGSASSSGSGFITNFSYTVKGNRVTELTPAQTYNGEMISASTEIATIRSVTATSLYLYFDDKGSDSGGTYETTEAVHYSNVEPAK